MAAHGDEPEHACSARRRRERRLRAWWRHEQFAFQCAIASATHHSANRSRRVDAETQTTQVVFPQERNSERTMEQIIRHPVKGPEIELMAPAPAGTRRRRLAERATLAAVAAYAAPVPAAEYVASSPSSPCRGLRSAYSCERTHGIITCGTSSSDRERVIFTCRCRYCAYTCQ